MPVTKKITPMGLIGSIMTLAAFVGMVFTVDARYMTRAEAADKTADVVQKQQIDRVETDISLVDLELKFLEEKKTRLRQENRRLAEEGHPQVIDEDLDRRLEYLKQRKLILEKYQLDLQSK